uniref:Uncharacterized protein n=1 Tax=Bacterium symbiont subsp. Theonella swinhoei (strain pTSMAC1) TaxID=1221190 RepID=J9ZVP9_BACS1|nr:unknown protein [bacterium symbiont of Theonella swinhoei pTSMAC1]
MLLPTRIVMVEPGKRSCLQSIYSDCNWLKSLALDVLLTISTRG